MNDINSKEDLIAYIGNGDQANFLYFWGHQRNKDGSLGKGCLSQWYISPFKLGGQEYPTAEHYMMAEKARLFQDQTTLKKILMSRHPIDAKKLGRSVKGYDEKRWRQQRLEIVVTGNMAKFSQNDELGLFLIQTNSRILVEASPTDIVWGVGLEEKHPHIDKPEKWRGLNLLGFALMIVRSKLMISEN